MRAAGQNRPASFLALHLRAFRLLAPEARAVVGIVAASLLMAAAQFADPVIFGQIVNRLASAGTAGVNLRGTLLLTALWALFGFALIGSGVLVALHADRLTHRRRLAVMAQAFEHMLHLPLSFHLRMHSGRLMKIMLEGANGLAAAWLPFLRDHCASLAALTLMMPLSLVLNWRLGLLLNGLVVLFGIILVAVLRRTEGLQGTIEHYHSEIAERAADALGNVPLVQSFTRVDAEVRSLRDVIGRLLLAQGPVLSWWAVAAVATRASAVLTVIAILLVGIFLDRRGETSVGQIVTFVAFSTSLILRLEQLVAFVNAIFMRSPKVRDLFAILDTAATVTDSPEAIDVGRLQGHVRFEGVTFSYDGQKDAVRGLTFEASPGATIALVGETGSGKSTTLSLLHRVFDPTAGRITIDGIDLRAMSLLSLRQNIGVVFQEPMLFARSIEENLQVGNPTATEAELRRALDIAQAAAFVRRQPDDIRTLMGERGRTLSGGERQRLAIARALLKDPPIMIFDEATSALDAATERQVLAAIEGATRGRTTFLIAHRLSTIRHADRILVFEAGQIVESGSFEELMARQGRFAALATAQAVPEPGRANQNLPA